MIKLVLNEFGKEVDYSKFILALNEQRTVYKLVMSSGYFAPMHSGHVDYLKDSSKYGRLHIAVVNDDESLKAKKGFVALPELERAKLVAAIRYVDYVMVWGGSDVSGLIKELRPAYFTNGGDRSTMETMNAEEVKACEEVGCQLLLGVGGSVKTNSSSDIIKNLLTNASSSGIIGCQN